MANIKSAKKRINVAEKKRVQNTAVKSEIKTFLKKFEASVIAKEVDNATELLKTCSGLLDSAATDGVIHKNKASRQKARLAKKLASINVA
ncbi:MAG: 30S ribosomal protein S20 [Firmicutes bacterium]|nr:30S ribosomal protein S20 [Bacillota bacterium]